DGVFVVPAEMMEYPVDGPEHHRSGDDLEAGKLEYTDELRSIGLDRVCSLNGAHALGDGSIANPDEGASECRRRLQRPEAEHGQIRAGMTTGGAPVECRSTVLDDDEAMAAGAVEDAIQFQPGTEEGCHDENARLLRDRPFQLLDGRCHMVEIEIQRDS